jgi:hypothetical protein
MTTPLVEAGSVGRRHIWRQDFLVSSTLHSQSNYGLNAGPGGLRWVPFLTPCGPSKTTSARTTTPELLRDVVWFGRGDRMPQECSVRFYRIIRPACMDTRRSLRCPCPCAQLRICQDVQNMCVTQAYAVRSPIFHAPMAIIELHFSDTASALVIMTAWTLTSGMWDPSHHE